MTDNRDGKAVARELANLRERCARLEHVLAGMVERDRRPPPSPAHCSSTARILRQLLEGMVQRRANYDLAKELLAQQADSGRH